jgi:hypothetical protein
MTIFLALLLVALMIATVVTLVRGIATFLMNSTAEVHGERPAEGPSATALKSNKMMQMRIMFQALAIVVVVLLLALAGKH